MNMKQIIITAAACIALATAACAEDTPAESPADAELTSRFARLALDCIHRSSLHPVFYGCFDWHSSVHGHWLLVRLLRTVPADQMPSNLRGEIITALNRSFTPQGVAQEVSYFEAENRASYERPYGLAWFLQLTAELREWQDPQARHWLETLLPLEAVIVAQIKSWLPKLAYAIRLGTHNQSMFAFGLFLDWAEAAGDSEMIELVNGRTLAFHRQDRNCPMAYEPSGEDFLSPCLMEADLMRRVLPRDQFAAWLDDFLPDIPRDGSGDWLDIGIVMDPTDGKLVHLDGVNLSRAWNLENIAGALPDNDPRIGSLMAAGSVHAKAGIANVSAEHYEGSHWLASFATYLVSRRGMSEQRDRDSRQP
jgi:hypothetical protein